MTYLVDGYNLIGFCDSISLGAANKEHALSRLLSSLSDVDMHLIFDGKNLNYPYGSREKLQSHTLIFTPPDESADDFIKQGCSKSKYKAWTVVTNDRDILHTCKKTKRLSISCENFLRRIVQNHPPAFHSKPAPTSTNTDYWLTQFGEDKSEGFFKRIIKKRPTSSHSKPRPISANIAYWLTQFGED